MPRVIRHPELRRTEILNCAESLFVAHGYDGASLNDVIGAAEISKGAFYHYFSSKEELLEALADRFAHRALGQVQDLFEKPQPNALTRLNRFLARTWRFKLQTAPENWPVFVALYRPENLYLYYRITTASIALFRPPVSALIVEGVQDGTFDTFDPEGVADMLLQLPLSTYALTAQVIAARTRKEREKTIAKLTMRLRLHGIALDRLLGLPDGSVRLVRHSDVQTIMSPPLQGGAKTTTHNRFGE